MDLSIRPHTPATTELLVSGNLPHALFQGSNSFTLAPTPAANPVDHKITVGANGELSYSPPNITANIGDTVTFEFHPKNHTVTESSFLHPCEALGETSSTPGFKSGLYVIFPFRTIANF